MSKSAYYFVGVRFERAGSVSLRIGRRISGTTTVIVEAPVTDLRWSETSGLDVRVVADGSHPTTIKAKVWPSGKDQPSRWNLVTRDNTPALQRQGNLGLAARVTTDSELTASSSVNLTYSNVKAKGHGKGLGSGPRATASPTPSPGTNANADADVIAQSRPDGDTNADALSPALSDGTPTPTPTQGTAATCPTSLGDAIVSTPNGGSLDIRGCHYVGSFTLSKPLTLVGGEITGRLFVRASGVVIDGLDIHGSTAGAQQGTIDVAAGYDRVTIRGAHVHDGDGTGIKIRGGSGHVIDGVEIDHMLQLGYGFSETTNLVMRNSLIHENNYTHKYSPGWEAGGGKMVKSTGALFENNESWGNIGPGFWDDGYDHGTVFRGNRAHDNTHAGIMVEISFDEVLENNVLWHNQVGQSSSWVWTSAILVSSSTGVVVRNNVIYDTDIGIGVAEQDRLNTGGQSPALYPPRGIRVEGNHVIKCRVLLAWADDRTNKTLFDLANNNGGLANFYWKSEPEPTYNRFAWGNHWPRTLADYEATGAEHESTYLSSSQKDTVLREAGIPTP